MPQSRFMVKPAYVFGAIVILSVLLHWNIWDRDIMGIHSWRQTQTMTVVENFANESMHILNPRINSRGDGDGIVRMEFPLMQWSFAWFYKLLGNKLITARILSFLISLFSIFGFYQLLRNWNLDKSMSALGAWCFSWSPVLFYYSVNPLPDNMALSFAIWSLVFLKKHQSDLRILSLLKFAVFLGLATAVKLPFILFGAGYIPIFFSQLQKGAFRGTLVRAGFLSVVMAPAIAWYIWVIPQWDNANLIGGIGAEDSFDYQSALSTIWGTLHSLLPELFVNFGSLLFLLFGITRFVQKSSKWVFYKSELSILFVLILYYLYEVNMIGLAHDYYLFPFLPLLFLIVSAGLKSVLANEKKWITYLGLIGLVIIPVTAYLRAADRWKPMGSEKVVLLHKEELRNLVPKDALVVVGNDPSTHIYLYHLGNKGWTFEQNWLVAEQLNDYVAKGAEYLFSNSNLIEESESLKQFTAEPIFKKDGITVYPLVPISDS